MRLIFTGQVVCVESDYRFSILLQYSNFSITIYASLFPIEWKILYFCNIKTWNEPETGFGNRELQMDFRCSLVWYQTSNSVVRIDITPFSWVGIRSLN